MFTIVLGKNPLQRQGCTSRRECYSTAGYFKHSKTSIFSRFRVIGQIGRSSSQVDPTSDYLSYPGLLSFPSERNFRHLSVASFPRGPEGMPRHEGAPEWFRYFDIGAAQNINEIRLRTLSQSSHCCIWYTYQDIHLSTHSLLMTDMHKVVIATRHVTEALKTNSCISFVFGNT